MFLALLSFAKGRAGLTRNVYMDRKNMGHLLKGTVAVIIVGVFGLFLIWKGIVGDGIRTSTDEELCPR